MLNHGITLNEYHMYVCPRCRRSLKITGNCLSCQTCELIYPIVNNIPDFILEDLSKNQNPTMRGVKFIDWLARIYETKWWYPLVLNFFGGWRKISFKQLISTVESVLGNVAGRILDIACGPGTFGRHIASQSKMIYGIDISMGMLQQGLKYVQSERIPNVHFARAKVEALPFKDKYFDGAICCGSLHLFSDTSMALKEISRTLKENAPLAVFTFAAGDAGILRFRRIRQHVQQDHGVHVFEIAELEQYLKTAGFCLFKPQLHGSILTFSATKCATD